MTSPLPMHKSTDAAIVEMGYFFESLGTDAAIVEMEEQLVPREPSSQDSHHYELQ